MYLDPRCKYFMVAFTPDVVGMNRADTKWFQKAQYLDLTAGSFPFYLGHGRHFVLVPSWPGGEEHRINILLLCPSVVIVWRKLSRMDSLADVSVAT